MQKIVSEQKSSVPILFAVSDEREEKEVQGFLESHFPHDKIVVINADVANEASKLFESAGKERTRIVVRLMAGREVDIPIDDFVNAAGGLTVVSLSPPVYKRQELQLKGRAGRAGKSGKYICVVAEDDVVFSLLSQADREQVSKAFRRNDASKIEAFIRKGQEKFETLLTEQNKHSRVERLPLLLIRKMMISASEKGSALSKDDIRIAQLFWNDFISIVATKFPALQIHSRPMISSEALGFLWSENVITSFLRALTYTKQLQQQRSPFLSNTQIRENVASFLLEHVGENIGF